jgi:hypothetical protein
VRVVVADFEVHSNDEHAEARQLGSERPRASGTVLAVTRASPNGTSGTRFACVQEITGWRCSMCSGVACQRCGDLGVTPSPCVEYGFHLGGKVGDGVSEIERGTSFGTRNECRSPSASRRVASVCAHRPGK